MAKSVVCLVTTPPERAQAIADALVEDELAACVNIVASVRSVYRWKGTVERDEESLLVVKTTSDALEALREALAELLQDADGRLPVVDAEGRPAGVLTLDAVHAKLRREAGAPSPG